MNFSEKQINKAILKKACPKDINKGGAHWVGDIYVDDKLVRFVTIPNPHTRIMGKNSQSRLAKQLNLTNSEYKEFVKCSLSKKEYFKLLKEKDIA